MEEMGFFQKKRKKKDLLIVRKHSQGDVTAEMEDCQTERRWKTAEEKRTSKETLKRRKKTKTKS